MQKLDISPITSLGYTHVRVSASEYDLFGKLCHMAYF